MSRYSVFWQVLFAGVLLMFIYWLFVSGVAKTMLDIVLSFFGILVSGASKVFASGVEKVRNADGFIETVFAIIFYFFFFPCMVVGFVCGITVLLVTVVTQPIKSIEFALIKLKEFFGAAFMLLLKFSLLWFVAIGIPIVVNGQLLGLGYHFIFAYWGLLAAFLFWWFFVSK
ncbi:hypothetical protein [Candidatus Ponderosibacter sp. Uisw_141_02]|uniref:hypothetical protein n=1 Tax=Candidatus Ponderosibacter sp. Uisw_141_02 TaxID=3231000 RepID=UPI003D391067